MINGISGNQMRRNTGITMRAFHQLRQHHTVDGLKTCEERFGTWDSVREPSPVSVAGSTTSIIFCCVIVVTKYVFSRDRSMLVATNIFFVFYCDKHNFFVTNVLSRQAYFCRYKHVFVATKRLSRQKRYLWQVPPIIVPVPPPGCFVLLFCNVGHDMTHYHLSVQLRSVTFIPREAFASYWLIKKTNSFTTTILYSVTRHLCVEMKNGIACHVSGAGRDVSFETKGYAVKRARFTILPLLYSCGQVENTTEECFVKPQKGNHVLFDEK